LGGLHTFALNNVDDGTPSASDKPIGAELTVQEMPSSANSSV
jgi:hypothetical protein